MRRSFLLAIAVILVSACQNWDLMRPDEAGGEADRAFTRLGSESRVPLTNALALRRVERITAARGAERLQLAERFFEEFPEARMFGLVHELVGEAHLAADSHEEAAVAFERALTLTRTDLLGIPIESTLPLQLGLAMASAGDLAGGATMLLRASVADRTERLEQALRWAYSNEVSAAASFDDWLQRGRDRVAVIAPEFSLPGLQQAQVDLRPVQNAATLLNFWSPT